MVKTAVVILNWNGKEYLERFLPFIFKYTPAGNTSVVVGDNGSEDDSVEFLEKEYPQVTIVRLDKNYGFAEGYNRVLRQVEAEYYVILNSDIEVTSGWLEPLIESLDKDPETAVVMPVIRSYTRREYFEHAGAAGGFIDRYGYPFCRGRILAHVEKDQGQYDQESEIFWATGACMCIKAGLFHKFGGFDDYMFAHMEEIDLCWRLKNAGYKIMFNPGSKVFHVGGGTLPNEHPEKLYLNFRNNLILLYRNLPAGKKRGILFIRMVLDGIAAIKFLLSLKPAYTAAVFRAHRDFYRIMPRYRKQLEGNPATITTLPGQVYPKSILFSYYFGRKRKYSQLRF